MMFLGWCGWFCATTRLTTARDFLTARAIDFVGGLVVCFLGIVVPFRRLTFCTASSKIGAMCRPRWQSSIREDQLRTLLHFRPAPPWFSTILCMTRVDRGCILRFFSTVGTKSLNRLNRVG